MASFFFRHLGMNLKKKKYSFRSLCECLLFCSIPSVQTSHRKACLSFPHLQLPFYYERFKRVAKFFFLNSASEPELSTACLQETLQPKTDYVKLSCVVLTFPMVFQLIVFYFPLLKCLNRKAETVCDLI